MLSALKFKPDSRECRQVHMADITRSVFNSPRNETCRSRDLLDHKPKGVLVDTIPMKSDHQPSFQFLPIGNERY
jgi:hypothetical protein